MSKAVVLKLWGYEKIFQVQVVPHEYSSFLSRAYFRLINVLANHLGKTTKTENFTRDRASKLQEVRNNVSSKSYFL